MSTIKPFKGWRPGVDIVQKLASRPYDVLNTEEARKECEGNPYSLLHVTKAEIDLPEGHKDSDLETYLKVVENFNSFKDFGWIKQDEEELRGGRVEEFLEADEGLDLFLNRSGVE